jgi:hypothetical protein
LVEEDRQIKEEYSRDLGEAASSELEAEIL